jgi:cytochrome c oxidase assembly factor CtaG
VPALRMLLLAAAVCLTSGYTFRRWEQQRKHRDLPVARSLPMLLFWWGGGVMSLLFALGWILERYFPLS